MTKKERAIECINALKKEYPDSLCSLDYKNSFELLVAARLSAQCTDARVNTITPPFLKNIKRLMIMRMQTLAMSRTLCALVDFTEQKLRI